MPWHFDLASDIGARAEQQDRVAVLEIPGRDDAHLVVLADGMGGQQQGAEAAQAVIDAARTTVGLFGAGDTAGRFLKALRDEKTILGNRCDGCSRVFVPPRKTCPACLTATQSWIPVANEGRVVAFTVARRQLAAIPRKVPVVFALIRLDGADTALLHTIGGVDPDRVAIGMRVRACFEPGAGATIMAIDHFEPTGK